MKYAFGLVVILVGTTLPIITTALPSALQEKITHTQQQVTQCIDADVCFCKEKPAQALFKTTVYALAFKKMASLGLDGLGNLQYWFGLFRHKLRPDPLARRDTTKLPENAFAQRERTEWLVFIAGSCAYYLNRARQEQITPEAIKPLATTTVTQQ